MTFVLLLCLSLLATTPTRVLILGDSLTAGYGVAKEESYPVKVQKLLRKEGVSVEVIGAGVSGATSASGPRRLKWHFKKKPDVLVLALGANDGLRGTDPKETQKNLLAAGQMAKKAGVRLIVLGMKAPPNYGKAFTKAHAAVYAAVAKKLGAPLLPFYLEGVAGYPKLNQADGIHPTEAGHTKVAEKLAPFLKKHLKQGRDAK